MSEEKIANVRMPNCLRCHVTMQPLMVMPLRVSKRPRDYVTELSYLGEKYMDVDVYRCPSCSQLELFDIDFSLPAR